MEFFDCIDLHHFDHMVYNLEGLGDKTITLVALVDWVSQEKTYAIT